MRFVHTMIRVRDLDAALDFWCNKIGLIETRRKEVAEDKFTLVFLAAADDLGLVRANKAPELELTYNWDSDEELEVGRSWGHIAYRVQNIYELCTHLRDSGVTINRPPRDGRMAFVKSPDGISVELLQEGKPLPLTEPWVSMENTGSW